MCLHNAAKSVLDGHRITLAIMSLKMCTDMLFIFKFMPCPPSENNNPFSSKKTQDHFSSLGVANRTIVRSLISEFRNGLKRYWRNVLVPKIIQFLVVHFRRHRPRRVEIHPCSITAAPCNCQIIIQSKLDIHSVSMYIVSHGIKRAHCCFYQVNHPGCPRPRGKLRLRNYPARPVPIGWCALLGRWHVISCPSSNGTRWIDRVILEGD